MIGFSSLPIAQYAKKIQAEPLVGGHIQSSLNHQYSQMWKARWDPLFVGILFSSFVSLYSASLLLLFIIFISVAHRLPRGPLGFFFRQIKPRHQ